MRFGIDLNEFSKKDVFINMCNEEIIVRELKGIQYF